ncbi:DUF262 domain-containing protein [Thalassobaculum sp.]|uniref:DUF262 domain-containing protein n=1 Tax=Thalassobaculum sp. TaxID=2022740 RepID=UPI0032EC97E9
MAEYAGVPDDQQEGLEDLEEAGKQYQAVINQTDWTVETIVRQIRKGNIELNPDFQRREAWRKIRKSQYIESLLVNIPVPQIVLAERKDQRGKFIVIDGKQRLLTLRQFHSTDQEFLSFNLEGLSLRRDLNGVNFDQLSTDIFRDQDLTALQNSTIRTIVIRNWEDELFLYSIFLRLNTGSVPLSPQELRQALHPGDFAKFVDKYSQESDVLHRAMGLSRPDPRMRDAELVIRYYAFRNFLDKYTGNLKPLLDETVKYFNLRWESHQREVQKQKVEFERAIDISIQIFGEKEVFRKWNGERYEYALNRAVFDVMMYYFSDTSIQTIAIDKKIDIVLAFKKICADDDFRSSIEGTTKSISAIFTRLKLWGEHMNYLNIPVEIPTLVGNKIILGNRTTIG